MVISNGLSLLGYHYSWVFGLIMGYISFCLLLTIINHIITIYINHILTIINHNCLLHLLIFTIFVGRHQSRSPVQPGSLWHRSGRCATEATEAEGVST
jgi:hypothetical protein